MQHWRLTFEAAAADTEADRRYDEAVQLQDDEDARGAEVVANYEELAAAEAEADRQHDEAGQRQRDVRPASAYGPPGEGRSAV